MASQLGRPELVIDEKNDTKADAGYGNFGTHIARRVQDAIKVGKKPAPWWQWCLRDLLGFEFEPEQYHVIVGVTDDWHTYCRREFSLKHSGRDFDFEGSRVVMLSSIHRLWDHLTNLRRPGSEKYYSGQIHIWVAVDFGYKLFWPVPPAYFHSGGGISFHGQSPSGKRLVTMISRQPRESAAQWLHEIDYVDALATKPIPHMEQRSNTPDSGYSSSDSRGADSDHETRSRRRSRNGKYRGEGRHSTFAEYVLVRNKSSGGSPMANQDSRNQSEKQAPTGKHAEINI
jgi:hypothetical protein